MNLHRLSIANFEACYVLVLCYIVYNLIACSLPGCSEKSGVSNALVNYIPAKGGGGDSASTWNTIRAVQAVKLLPDWRQRLKIVNTSI